MARGKPLIRQWNVLKTLQSHRFGVTSDELAKRVKLSKRQVLRDLSVLRRVGFPIRNETRDLGKKFWLLASNFIERESLVLSVTEMLSLFLSQKLMAPLAGTSLGGGYSAALEKIKVLLPKKALDYFADLDNSLLVKNLAFHDYSGKADEIQLINQGISLEQILKVRYRSGRDRKVVDTLFHPYGLALVGVNLYAIGYMEVYSEVRSLKISRLQRVELTDWPFDRPAGFSLEKYTRDAFGIFTGKRQTIRARFTGWAANSVRELQWHTSQKLIEDHDDYCLVQFDVAGTQEFKRWILGFGPNAAVLEPASLALEIRRELRTSLDVYNRLLPMSDLETSAVSPPVSAVAAN